MSIINLRLSVYYYYYNQILYYIIYNYTSNTKFMYSFVIEEISCLENKI